MAAEPATGHAGGHADERADEHVPPPTASWRTFGHLLAGTAVANLATSFLWWALVFWAYLGTRSVLVTGLVGGTYMLLVAGSSLVFGGVVDHHRKLDVLRLATAGTLTAFALAGVVYLAVPDEALLDLGAAWFWLLALLVLSGTVLTHLRTIALSTCVTLLVPDAQRARANGLVGAVAGLGSVVTGVFSGLSVGLLGMGWTIVVSLAVLAATLAHLLTVRFPQDRVAAAVPTSPALERARARRRAVVDLRGSLVVIRAAQGLLGLLVFSTFNNFVGGLFLTLVDPYGLELVSVQTWGLLLGLASTGYLVGGGLVARFGLGRDPLRTLLLAVAAMGVVGAGLALRETIVLAVAGIFGYMCLVPVIEAAEQTVIQRVVPLERQGRVFGFAQALESAAAPVAAFVVAPVAQLWVLPWARTDAGRAALAPLLGEGDARGIALVFLVGGLLMVVAGLVGLRSRTYRTVSATYRAAG